MRLLVRGAAVYDGTGAAPFKGEVLVENGLILDAGPNLALGSGNDFRVIEGKAVCPGFIDPHRHADVAVFTSPDFGKTELLQGITTLAAGNCGISPVPGNHPWQDEHYRYIEPVIGPVPRGLPLADFGQYRSGLEARSLPLNFGFLAGTGAIKTSIKGFSTTAFNQEEMERAKHLVREALGAGALGLSFGLMYSPECYSLAGELTALAREAAGTVLCVHLRGEGDSLLDSIDEMILLAEAACIPVNISHFKATGIKNWSSLIFRGIEKIEAARHRGLEITADFYPYDGGSTTILSLVPPALTKDSISVLSAKLARKDGRDLLRREINQYHPGWDNMALSIGWDRIIISSVNLPEHDAYCGRNMEAIAAEEGFADPIDLLAALVSREEGRVGIIALSMNSRDIDTVACLPWTCLISDSLYGPASKPHPRLNGAFPKFLREYTRERPLLTLAEGIKKMTFMPAQRLGMTNRGRILPGNAADLLIFDPEEFTDNAGYLNSTALASGMGTVILNGSVVYNEGRFFDPNGCFVSRGE